MYSKTRKTNILLLTATISPKLGTPNLTRTDPAHRLKDYAEALSFYLDFLPLTFAHIVFCENSDSDVSLLYDLVHRRNLQNFVTFFVKDGLDYPPHFDRGYGEFKLVDDAMGVVKQLQETRSIIWKVTGRYIIKNIATIIRNVPPNADLYCNFRNRPKRWVDTYLIGWTPEIYQTKLRGVYDLMKTNVPEVPLGVSAEELLRSYLKAQTGLIISKRFPATPDVRGVRAADNRKYQNGFNVKYQIRRGIRIFAPWIWI